MPKNTLNKRAAERRLLLQASVSSLGVIALLRSNTSQAKTYLTIEQAKQILLPNIALEPVEVRLTKEQKKAIQTTARVPVRSLELTAWKSTDQQWFIVDQIIGKHENIDMAFAFGNKGEVIGLEVLTYRESYGHEIRHPKWRAQFHGRDHSEHLILNKQIKNISGATLSCRHVTDGINRLSYTWKLVLQHL